jgi:hypothetical protein
LAAAATSTDDVTPDRLPSKPPRIPDVSTWLQAIAQWTEASAALPLPLSEWPERWAKDKSAVITFGNRRRLWNAYVACDSNEDRFLAAWPQSTMSKKLAAIKLAGQVSGTVGKRAKRAAQS